MKHKIGLWIVPTVDSGQVFYSQYWKLIAPIVFQIYFAVLELEQPPLGLDGPGLMVGLAPTQFNAWQTRARMEGQLRSSSLELERAQSWAPAKHDPTLPGLKFWEILRSLS